MNTRSSPKLFFDSLFAALKFSSNSTFFLTILIPLPPPPADAFSKTGYPILFEIFNASFEFFTGAV